MASLLLPTDERTVTASLGHSSPSAQINQENEPPLSPDEVQVGATAFKRPALTYGRKQRLSASAAFAEKIPAESVVHREAQHAEGDRDDEEWQFRRILRLSDSGDSLLVRWASKHSLDRRRHNTWIPRDMIHPNQVERFERKQAAGKRPRVQKKKSEKQNNHKRKREQDTDTWAVDCILRYRASTDKYLVRWLGTTRSGVPYANTWEPAENLNEAAKEDWNIELKKRKEQPQSSMSGKPCKVLQIDGEDHFDAGFLKCQIASTKGSRSSRIRAENVPYNVLGEYDGN